jgi:GNAT superfamily N-acetyltransferase
MIEVRYLSALAPDRIAEAARNTHALWGGQRTLDDHVTHTLAQVERSSGLMRMCGLEQGGELVASLKRFHLRLRTPTSIADTVGIGAVFTPESQRGRGHAKRLLGEMMNEAREEGFQLAMLYSDIAPTFYHCLGFVTLSHLLWSAPRAALPATASLDLTPCVELAPLLELYEASWRHPCLRTERDEVRWRYLAWRNQASEPRLLRSGSGTVVGYVSCKGFGDVLWIDDLVSLEVEVEAVYATLAALAHEVGANTVAGWLRPEHAGGPFHATVRDTCIPMVAALSDQLGDVASMPSHFAPLDHF